MAAAAAFPSVSRLQLLGRWASVTTTNRVDVANFWLRKHILDAHPIPKRIGFDSESHPVYRQANQLAILQFAVPPAAASASSSDIQVLLFSIHSLGPDSPIWLPHCPALSSVLSDISLTKFAIDTRGDIASMAKIQLPVGGRRGDAHTHTAGEEGFVDLQMHPLATALVGPKQRMGSGKMAAHFLGIDLPKDEEMQRSKWGKWPLTEKQVLYGAQDAVLALLLAEALHGGSGGAAGSSSSS